MKALRTTALFLLAFVLAACNDSSSSTGQAASAAAPSVISASATSVGDPLSFSASSYSVAQDSGSVSVTVSRVGSAVDAVSVGYTTTDGTAVGGTDYTATSGTLQWAENDSTPRTIIVPISNSLPFAGTKTFQVALSNPSAAAQIASPDIATVIISGDTSASVGAVELSDATYTVQESSGLLTVTANRIGGSRGAVGVTYGTFSGTATAGTDFTAVSGTLQWADGDATSKTFTVPISNTVAFDGTKTFNVSLFFPTGGLTVGIPAAASAVIVGSSSPVVGALEFSASSYDIVQGVGSVTITVNRVGGTAGAVSVAYATGNGPAIAPASFTAASGTLQWADGDSTAKTFTVAINNATPFSGNQLFTVALSSPTGGATIGNPGLSTVTIAGDAGSPIGDLALSSAGYTVAQNAGSLSVTVNRSGGANGTVSVNYATTNGSAVAGVDFTAASGILQWADGDTAPKSFSVAISNATPFSGSKSFVITLANATGGAALSNPMNATAVINGSAAAAAGNLQLGSNAYRVSQIAGSVSVTVNRTGGSNGAASVSYATSNGTATAGTDFTAVSGTIQWADGDASSKSFTVPISSATPFAGTKTFTVALSNPSQGSALASPSSASVNITGEGSANVGSFAFSQSAYSIAQSAGSIKLTVDRSDGASGAVSVSYATSNGSAQAGTNYTATNGTLQWADGDSTAKTFSVDISNADSFVGSKTFNVTLSNPNNGTSLGTPSSTVVTIAGAGGSSGSGGPSAPSNLLMTSQNASSISLSWGAASPGNYPIEHYQIYRNGSAYATTSGTSYTDNGASNATNRAYDSAATIYSYTVAAVDTQGNEGPQTSQTTFDVYSNGVFSWGGDYSYSAWANYKDSSGVPESGPYDIEITVTGSYGGYQPYAGNTVPQWDLEAGSFGYISMDLKPTTNGQVWDLSAISRLPPGDVYPWSHVSITNYGPTPQVGKWATYKIPLSALTIGKTSFTGSISGTTLTVSSVNGGVGVDAGGFISGDGVAPGTYILGFNAKGGTGTYTVYPSQNVARTSMTEQRTAVYKIDISDQTGSYNNHYYIDNLRFTQN
jgi:hypothetical protein